MKASRTPATPACRPLTPRQAQALTSFRGLAAQLRRDPTVREFGAAVGCSSTQTAHRLLRILREKGYLGLGNGRPGERTEIQTAIRGALETVAAAAFVHSHKPRADTWDRLQQALTALLDLGWKPAERQPAHVPTPSGDSAGATTER